MMYFIFALPSNKSFNASKTTSNSCFPTSDWPILNFSVLVNYTIYAVVIGSSYDIFQVIFYSRCQHHFVTRGAVSL